MISFQLNQRHFPQHLFNDSLKADADATTTDADVDVDVVKSPTFFDLFHPRTILLRSLNMFYQWFSVTMSQPYKLFGP
jgi:hypothetical protein